MPNTQLAFVDVLSPKQLVIARRHIHGMLDPRRQKTLAGQDEQEFRDALATTWAHEFRQHVLATYVLDAVDEAVLPPSLTPEELAKRLTKERDSVGGARMKAGWRFAIAGAGFILSNLIVLPLMAAAISRFVEHPAATAINSFERWLQVTSADESKDGPKSALANMRALSGSVTDLKAITSRLTESAEKLASDKVDADPVQLPGVQGLNEALKELAKKLAPTDPNAPAGPNTPKPADVLAQFIAVSVADRAAKLNLRITDGASEVTPNYLVVALKPEGWQTTLSRCLQAFDALESHARHLKDKQAVIAVAKTSAVKMAGENGDGGVMQQFSSQLTKLDDAGKALNELVATGPKLARDARAATDVLSSVSGFVLPYAFVVLAIGAMLMTIGVTSIMRSLKHVDDKYDEVVDLNRTLRLARLAAAMQAQGVPADAIVERLARVGDVARRADGGIPLPVARALGEIAKNLRQG